LRPGPTLQDQLNRLQHKDRQNRKPLRNFPTPIVTTVLLQFRSFIQFFKFNFNRL